jgi:hypothetical protein
LGELDDHEENFDSAKNHYEESLNLMKKEAGLRTHQMVGATYNRLGCQAQKDGNLDLAM